MDYNMKIDFKGENIKQIRTMRGFSQKQLSEGMGISQPYLSQIERGERRLTAEDYRNAMEFMGVDLKVSGRLASQQELIETEFSKELGDQVNKEVANKLKKWLREASEKYEDTENENLIVCIYELYKMYVKQKSKVLIDNNVYDVYRNKIIVNNLLGKMVTIDWRAFESSILNDIDNYCISGFVKTIEGYDVEFYYLNAGLEYADNLPIVIGGHYMTMLYILTPTDYIDARSVGVLKKFDKKNNKLTLVFGYDDNLREIKAVYSIYDVVYDI